MFYRRFDLSRDSSIGLLQKAIPGQLRFAASDRFRRFELPAVQRERPKIEFHVINDELLKVGIAGDYERDDACRVLSWFVQRSPCVNQEKPLLIRSG